MSLYVRLKDSKTVKAEYSDCWDDEYEEYVFENVSCSQDMLDLIDENVWYKVEYDEDGDVRPSMLFGAYASELIIDTMED